MGFNHSLRFPIAAVVALAFVPLCAVQREPKTLAEINGPFRLTEKPLRITLPRDSVRAILQQSSAERLFVVVRGLSAQREPGTTFALYLDLPDGAPAEERELHRLGTLNFFGVATLPELGGETSTEWRSYGLTAVARRLLARGRLSDLTTLTIEAHRTPVQGSDATIGSISLVQR
jgi:hypothetical protein